MSTAFVNGYTPTPAPVPAESELYGPDPYDINFAFPLHEESLQTPRLKLVPFVPREHAAAYWDAIKDHPELFQYYPFRHDLPQFLTFLDQRIRSVPGHTLFAVLDRTRADPSSSGTNTQGALAGVIGLVNTSLEDFSTELAYVVVLPASQHTHVAKETVGVLLRYLLNLPSASPPGLGMRRVQWSAHPANRASIGLAERMGFRKEGTLRNKWVLPDSLGHMGKKREAADDPAGGRAARDSVLLSVCWDDWEGGVRERVESVLDK